MPNPNMIISSILFALRCAIAATLAFLTASYVGLAYPVWAAMSALIVSQDKLNDTTNAFLWRVIGTLIGVVIAVSVGSLLALFSINVPLQMMVSIFVCAIIIQYWSKYRVAMWTAPIVFMNEALGEPLIITGLERGAEVLIGAIIGAALHWLAQLLLKKTTGRTVTQQASDLAE